MALTDKLLTKKFWVVTLVAMLVLAGGATVGIKTWYSQNLKPVSSSESLVFFTIESGSSAQQISAGLYQAGLIRSTSAFETYVTANNYRSKLQAGTYRLSPSMSVQTIVGKMVNGEVAKDLLTILPGKRLDQVQQTFRDAGYSSSAVRAAFNPSAYKGHPALASLPKGASLEGYLYPDSFHKQANTPATTIVRQSLDEMAKHLTSDLNSGLRAQGLTVFEGITLASVVLKETDHRGDQPIVAQVLLTRLKRDMLLQADATAFYAADVRGVGRSLSIASTYNTYLHKGLPPGPISNVTVEALKAVAQPAGSEYLYYVTGDDNKTRFSYTLEEHQAKVERFCKIRCGR